MANEIISRVDRNLNTYCALKATTKEAKAIDNSIKFSDVQEWLGKRVKNKSKVEGTNSCLAHGPYQ